GRVSAWSWSTSCRLEYKVAGDDNPHREARPDGQRRLNLQLALDDLLARLIDGILRAVSDRPDQPVLVAGSKFGSDREQRGEASRFHQIPPVVIDAILKAGVAAGVRARQALQNDGTAARQDQ